MSSILSEATPTSNPLIYWLTQGGAVGILAIVCYLFLTGRLVAKSTYQDAIKQRDKALEQVYRLGDLATKAVQIAEKVSPKNGDH